MSRTILTRILNELRNPTYRYKSDIFWNLFFNPLTEQEFEQLYQELLFYFGLVGASNQCEALDQAWTDPYNRQQIEEFIKAWLRRKQKKKKPITGHV